MLLTEDSIMYEDILKDMQEKMKPVTEMAEINKDTAEKLISLQSEYMTDLFNTGIAQMKALGEVKEPKTALEMQVKYFKEIEAKMTDTAEKELAAISSAKEKLSEIIEKSMFDMSEAPIMNEMTKFMKTAQEKMEEAAKAFTPEPVKKTARATKSAAA
jgi:hypothetical protein